MLLTPGFVTKRSANNFIDPPFRYSIGSLDGIFWNLVRMAEWAYLVLYHLLMERETNNAM